MAHPSKQEEKKDYSKYLAILLLLGAGILALYSLDSRDSKASRDKNLRNSQAFEKAVNKHLMNTNESIEMARQRTQIENARTAQEFNRTRPQPTYAAPNNTGVDLSSDARTYEIANELGRGERKPDTPIDPHDIVQKELFTQQQMDEYSRAYKEEYVRQFVENARRGGYKVEVDENFKVLRVTPIRKPSQSYGDILNSGGSGVQ